MKRILGWFLMVCMMGSMFGLFGGLVAASLFKADVMGFMLQVTGVLWSTLLVFAVGGEWE